MNQDDLKSYSVIVENGSGCFFQPMTMNYTYILTAKHLFLNEIKNEQGQKIKVQKPDGTAINIIRLIKKQDTWIRETIPFELRQDENFFLHEKADIAILKINYMDGYNAITVQDTFENDKGFALCGFPESLQDGAEYTSRLIESFIGSGNQCYCALLSPILGKHNIDGMSGSGILKLNDDGISIIGIQSKMASTQFPAGQIGFVPLKFAKEITEANPKQLEPLLPPYFSSFKFLKDEIFQISFGVLTKERVKKLTNILLAKAVEVENSQLTPKYIKDFLEEKLPSVYEQDKLIFNEKKIWSLWLELLAIMNVLKNHRHCKADLPQVLEKIRLFYSNTNSDYWEKHLHELHKFDYSGLETNGLVVVASNSPARDDMHILQLSKIPPSVYRINKAIEEFDLQNLGQKLDEATGFPLQKFRFANISAFKNGIVSQLNEDFDREDIANCITILNKLYANIISD